jgi:hypothetical protein
MGIKLVAFGYATTEKYKIWSKEIETVNPFINHTHIITNSNYTIDCIRKSGYQQQSILKILTACIINRTSR